MPILWKQNRTKWQTEKKGNRSASITGACSNIAWHLKALIRGNCCNKRHRKFVRLSSVTYAWNNWQNSLVLFNNTNEPCSQNYKECRIFGFNLNERLNMACSRVIYKVPSGNCPKINLENCMEIKHDTKADKKEQPFYGISYDPTVALFTRNTLQLARSPNSNDIPIIIAHAGDFPVRKATACLGVRLAEMEDIQIDEDICLLTTL